MKIYIDTENKFFEQFNPKTGFYIRSGVLDEKGKDTDVDPFQRNYPGLIDIGIMGWCEHGQSGLCMKSGIQCYQDGLNIQNSNMSVEDFRSIIEQSRGKVFQVALGGRGDPNKHENFQEILEICRENEIVPNFTTSGFGLTEKEVYLTKKYCGAVAVSEYRSGHTNRALQMFIDAGCKTNIHYVLGQNTIDEAIEKLETDSFFKGINAVIFLLHKPVGLGTRGLMLKATDEKLKQFVELVDQNQHSFKIGFDSCTVPALINMAKNISPESMDTCEAARHSCYIDADMNMVPCSFDQEQRWKISLKEKTVKEVWDSEEFNSFRQVFHNACGGCESQRSCLGGCPIIPEIVLCERKC
jgi:radical SAM protein with 4Fe4S-binding SPASM domain